MVTVGATEEVSFPLVIVKLAVLRPRIVVAAAPVPPPPVKETVVVEGTEALPLVTKRSPIAPLVSRLAGVGPSLTTAPLPPTPVPATSMTLSTPVWPLRSSVAPERMAGLSSVKASLSDPVVLPSAFGLPRTMVPAWRVTPPMKVVEPVSVSGATVEPAWRMATLLMPRTMPGNVFGVVSLMVKRALTLIVAALTPEDAVAIEPERLPTVTPPVELMLRTTAVPVPVFGLLTTSGLEVVPSVPLPTTESEPAFRVVPE